MKKQKSSSLEMMRMADNSEEGVSTLDFSEKVNDEQAQNFKRKYNDFYNDVKHKVSEDW